MAKTLAELREMHKNMNADPKKTAGSSNGFWSPKEGDNLVRFLPGKEDPLDFFVETKLHAYQDEGGKWNYYKCRRVEHEKCPMCELKGEPANMTAKGSQHSRKADTITPTIAVILDHI